MMTVYRGVSRIGIALAVGVVLVLAAAGEARADQCAIVTKKQAEAARAVLATKTAFLQYCTPCGDPEPTSDVVVSLASVEVKKTEGVEGGYEVHVNGGPVDLAYTYYLESMDLKNKRSVYRNVAADAGCPAEDVPGRVTVVHGSLRDPFADPKRLSGTWVLTFATVYSSCAKPAIGDSETVVWTVTASNNQFTAKSSSGNVFSGVVMQSTPPSILFRPTKQPSSNGIHLWFTSEREMAGRQWYALSTGNKDDPVCVIYRDVTAAKQ